MKIHINEHESAQETEIIINCQRTDEQILRIIAMLQVFDKKVTGMKDNQTFILDAKAILYVDTVDKHAFLYTTDNVYETPFKLYELEEQLEDSDFFRASKSLIINFNQIKSLRPELGGKMQVIMSNNEKLYVSRQYVTTIKQKLGLL